MTEVKELPDSCAVVTITESDQLENILKESWFQEPMITMMEEGPTYVTQDIDDIIVQNLQLDKFINS